MRWPDINEIDGETECLYDLVNDGWSWSWPGWKWITEKVNQWYGNNRSISAITQKYYKIYEKKSADSCQR